MPAMFSGSAEMVRLQLLQHCYYSVTISGFSGLPRSVALAEAGCIVSVLK